MDTLERYSLHDLEIICPLGFSDEGIEELKGLKDVKDVEGSYVSYNVINLPDSNTNVKISVLTKSVDLPFNVEGKLPEKKGEITINKRYASKYGVGIGDALHLDDPENLACSDLKVTAMADSVLYVNDHLIQNETSPLNGAVCQGFFDTTEDTFDKTAFPGYTEILITTDYTYTRKEESDDYYNKIEKFKDEALSVCNGLYPYSALDKLPVSIESGQIDKLKCNALTRNENKSQNLIDLMPDIVEKIRNDLGITLLVGCMIICVFAIMRLIKTNGILIGTQLSFGIPERRIILTYSGFVIFAGTTGCIMGALIGRVVIIPLIMMTLKNFWAFEKTVFYFSLTETLLVFACVIALIALVAFVACKIAMRKKILDLLSGNADDNLQDGLKGKTRLWKKMSLINRSALNNLRSDKLRVVTTVVGIAITSALLVNGFGIDFLFPDTTNKYFSEIGGFNYVVYIDPACDGAEADIADVLNSEGIKYTSVYTSYVALKTETGNENFASIIVGDADIANMIHCYDPYTYKNVPLREDQTIDNCVLIGSGMGYYEDVFEGNKLTVIDMQGKETEVVIGGLYKHYLSDHQVLISKEKFTQFFGYEPKNNAFLIKCSDSGDLTKKLISHDGFVVIDDYEVHRRGAFRAFSQVSMV
ncbi:MAG: ABC transporter permease, partial [Clostridia bacterium]|nr:ABC transporter permease [Clostridia bacterium]